MTNVIDQEWFSSRLKDQNMSLRSLAKNLGMDPGAVSRTFSGQRKMQMEEARQIAHFLRVPVSDVMAHAGVSVDLDGVPNRIMLAAVITEDGLLNRLPEPKTLPQGLIERAHAAISKAGNGRIIAAQIRASDGPLALWDDAVVLFMPTEDVEPSAIGMLAIYRCRDTNTQGIARLLRARKTGEALIQNADGGTAELILETAAPVLAVLP